MKAIRLRTEYLPEPMGLDITKPRFYWNCEGGMVQTAYRITAMRDGKTVFDTGKVQSGSMTHIPYEGEELHSRDRVIWSVQLWDENDVPGEASESWFELGLLKPTDWHAQWITGGYAPRKNERYPADCFLKEFSLKKPVQRARLYITACGLYEATLNGTRVGDFVMTPGCTDYRKRIQYQTYDVTHLLGPDNRLEVELADGWYRGSLGAYGQTAVYGRQTKLLCQMEIIYEDGSNELVISGGSWRWSNDGPVRFADLKDGEAYDAAKKPSYSGQAVPVKEKIVPTASNNVPVREKEHFQPTMTVAPSGKIILDFGQNIAGFIAFRVHGERGQQVKLRMGETLDANGELYQGNMQLDKPVKEWGQAKAIMLMMGKGDKLREAMQPTPLQEVVFRCSGGEDSYKTRFAVFGFRYCEVETDIDIKPEDFEAIAVYSDLEQVGEFECSHPGVNQLFSNILWSMKGNFLDIPTDCPTRERLGWTGDAQIFFNAGAYLMDTAAFFRKWLVDLDESRLKNGLCPSVVPYAGMDMMYNNSGSSAGWADAMVLVPYRYWKRFGDCSALERHCGMLSGFARYLIAHTGHKDKKQAQANPYNKYVYEKGVHLGEWLEPEEFRDDPYASHKPNPEVPTAYLHYSMRLLAEIAHELGKFEDEKLYREYANGAKKAYCWMFLQDGAPDTDRQAKLVRPLALGLTEGDDALTTALQNRLAQAVVNRDAKISTGFLSTAFVLDTLTKAGRPDLAYQMLENEQAPGWLFQVNHGATTVWEEWEGENEGKNSTGSLNHYSPGAVVQWMFDTVAGIRPDGENRFVIAPIPGGTLTHASASYQSLYGKVESRWEKTEGGVRYTVTVPPNTTARVILPDGGEHIVGAGQHTFG